MRIALAVRLFVAYPVGALSVIVLHHNAHSTVSGACAAAELIRILGKLVHMRIEYRPCSDTAEILQNVLGYVKRLGMTGGGKGFVEEQKAVMIGCPAYLIESFGFLTQSSERNSLFLLHREMSVYTIAGAYLRR